MVNILIVDDKKSIRNMLTMLLEEKGYKTFSRDSAEAALDLLTRHPMDIVITDLKMPYMGGLELLEKLNKISPHTSALMITAYGTINDAVTAMKLGAVDFIEKPFTIELIEEKIQKLIEKRKLPPLQEEQTVEMVGTSQGIQNLRSLINKVAPTPSSILIIGESGTGKELVAQAIHDKSQRKDKPFIAVNCGALVDSLLENELFGHEKGAFTGAQNLKKGRFELADKGTLFLDEIGEMKENLQVKFLRVLQKKSFERVGGSASISTDVRIIAATNKDLASLAKEGTFREDLYYRLNVVTIKVPPLRERKEDIAVLSSFYLEKYAKSLNKKIQFSPETQGFLQAYSWPGNVRELKNVIERGAIFAEEFFTPADLPEEIQKQLNIPEIQEESKVTITEQLELIEEQLIRQMMEKCQGNQTLAAKELGIGRTALHYKLKKYGIVK